MALDYVRKLFSFWIHNFAKVKDTTNSSWANITDLLLYIIYMFDQDEDGSYLVPVFEDIDYYGELTYTITYKGEKESFPWLFIDYNTLQNAAHHNGLLCELIAEGEAYNYLARLRRKA